MAVRNHQLARLALFLALSVAHTWPLATDLAHLSRFDHADARLNAWILTWVGRTLVHDPGRLFDAPMFHPEPDVLAYSESLIAQGAIAAPLLALGASPLVAFNLIVISGLALTGWATSVLLGRWTGRIDAGILGGCLVAFNTHLFTRLTHIQALHVEFLPLALLALDHLLERARIRDAVSLAAAFTAQALCSGYLLVLTTVALAAAALARAGCWLRVSADAGRRLLLLAGAGVLAMVALWPFLAPYVRVRRTVGLVRPLDEVARYSAKPLDYVTTIARVHYDTWSQHLYVSGTDALFPGALALVLAGIALFTGVAFRDRRARMLLALGAAGFALSFGPALPGYEWLYRALPLLQGIRGAARFGYLAMVGVAGLAAFGLAVMLARLEGAGGLSRRRATALAIAAITIVNVEAWIAPLDLTRFDGVSPVYQALAAAPDAVVAEFPFPPPDHVARNSGAVLAAAYHGKPLVNGYSGFTPASYAANADAFAGFPDARALRRLRDLGVTHVVVHLDDYDDGQALQRRLDAVLDLQAAAGSTTLYRLR